MLATFPRTLNDLFQGMDEAFTRTDFFEIDARDEEGNIFELICREFAKMISLRGQGSIGSGAAFLLLA